MTTTAIIHDYLTQRGGAERVVLSLARAFPAAEVYTSLYDLEATYPEFSALSVRPSQLNRFGTLRRDHRLALPFLATTFGRLSLEADLVVASSSGWAHGARASGKKLVYCYSPARWLYQPDRYLGADGFLARSTLRTLARPLKRWDQRAAQSADRYVTLSRMVRDQIRTLYGIDAEIVPPPYSIDPNAEQEAICQLDPGFFLCVARLLPYKNVDVVIEAFNRSPDDRLVVVGTGPQAKALALQAHSNVTLLGTVTDAELRWLYANCSAVVAASYEDYGLTPLEALAFGRPSVVLRYGGFLDTVVHGVTGVHFDAPTPDSLLGGLRELRAAKLQDYELRRHARLFTEDAFISKMRSVATSIGYSPQS